MGPLRQDDADRWSQEGEEGLNHAQQLGALDFVFRSAPHEASDP